MKIINLEKRDEIKFTFGASCSMVSSCIEHIDQKPNITIGYGVKLKSCHITVHKGGTLVIKDLCELRGRIIVGENSLVEIGYGLVCNDSIFIHSEERSAIIIKDDCLFANPRIYNTDMHGIYDIASGKRINKAKDVLIGSRTWLARESLVLKGSQIGDGCVVGAGSIVSGSYEDSSLIAGSPARVIKTGIAWSRSVEDELSKLLPFDFPSALFRSMAVQHKHEEVIRLGIHIWENRQHIKKSDYYAIYYLSRALLLKEFKGSDLKHVDINGITVSLVDVYNSLLGCFELSAGMNAGCGSCAYLAAKLLGDNDAAHNLYQRVRPTSDHIDNKLYAL